jgi:FlaA1/EpsC-like NDP-sugar epimerase
MVDSGKSSRQGALVAWSRENHAAISVALHAVLFVFAWFMAFGLAYNFKSPTLGAPVRAFCSLLGYAPSSPATADDWFTAYFLPLLPPVLIIKTSIFVVCGLHRASWRYVSLRDVFAIMRAAWLSFLGIFVLYYSLQNARWLGLEIEGFGAKFPDSVFLLDFAGTIALVAGARFGVRLYHEEVRSVGEGAAPKLLILGAGDAGEAVVREILRMPIMNYRVVGFLDDDRAKQGTQIHGIEVLGPIENVKEIAEEYAVDELLIAVPSATRQRLRRVIELCQGTNLRFKTVPGMADLIAGRATVSEFRDFEINDLLGRAPVKLDEDEIGAFIRDRVIAVTGAGGSIGAEMCRQVARFHPRRLVLIEQAEPGLFPIDQELRREFSEIEFVPYIADIADRGRVNAIFDDEHPSAVFHAAAHKHVPMMELNPGEAVKNNVRGTRIVADAATANGVEKFIMISTDKAVNPTSIMGGSKRVAEMYIQALDNRCDTEFITVRFGNVLGSSGSVIPIFKEQIRRGGPVTVTHPEMVRYFMTIPEASQLVLQAASMGHGGEIFVLDMGEPVKIVDLAREMITLSGLRPDVDIKIEFSGVRPGEKLYEELAIDGEGVARTPHPKVGIWQNIASDWDELVAQIDRLIADADGLDRIGMRERLKEIVPEFYVDAATAGPQPQAAARTEAATDTPGAEIAPA